MMTIVEINFKDEKWRVLVRSNFVIPDKGDKFVCTNHKASNSLNTEFFNMIVESTNYRLEADGQGYYNQIIVLYCREESHTPSEKTE